MENHQLSKRRRMAPGSASGSIGALIPDDILFFKILILLPAKCLVRFQSVCKLWRSTIISTSFARCHLRHSRLRPSMVMMPRLSPGDPAMFKLQGVTCYRFQPGQSKVTKLILDMRFPRGIPMFTIPLQCDGLIMIPCYAGRIFMCNPTTNEFVELPRGSHNVVRHQSVAFGFDPWSGKYKVARHFFRSYNETPPADGAGTVMEQISGGHEMLTLGDGEDDWKWKATVDPPYPINARTPICLPGFFYWSALQSMSGHGFSKVKSHVILRFSMRDETFTVHPNPPCRDFLGCNDMLCELGGNLCYVHSASQWEVAIWLAVPVDGPNLDWSLRCRIRLPIPRNLNVFACASLDDDREKIFLSIDAWYLIKCDLRDGSFEEIVDMPRDITFDKLNGIRFRTDGLPVAHYILPCVESLLRIRPYDDNERGQINCM